MRCFRVLFIGVLLLSATVWARPKQTIVLATPRFEDAYYAKMYDRILDFQIRYARKIAKYDKVEIWTDQRGYKILSKELSRKWLRIHPMQDIWMRDFSTVGLTSPVLFRYTAAAQSGDQKEADFVQGQFNQSLRVRPKRSKYKLDGGNVVWAPNKAIVTERFLEDNRLGDKKAKAILRAALGVENVALIPSDDPAGLAHADGMVSFIEEDVLLVNKYPGKLRQRIMNELKANFPSTKVVEIPSAPSLQVWEKGISSACGVHINILSTHRAIYVPTFGKPLDKKVLKTIQSVTAKPVVSVDASQVCKNGRLGPVFDVAVCFTVNLGGFVEPTVIKTWGMSEQSKPLNFSDHFYIDKNLRDVAKDPGPLRARIDYILAKMLDDEETEERIKHLGEIGGLYRVLGELELAEQYLGEALSLIREDELEPRFFVVHGTRLAHVWQWQKRFEESNPMFEELIKVCSENRECENLLDFVYQHHGKNLFDQKRYEEALRFFEQAMALRQRKGNSELISSTEQALQRTKELI